MIQIHPSPGYRTPKKSVDTIQNLDTSLNRNQNLDGSERSMHHHDGNRSPPRNKSIRGNRHSKSRTRSKPPLMARRNHHITIAEQLRIVTMQNPLRGLINQNI